MRPLYHPLFAIAIVLALSAAAHTRNGIWTDEVSLCTDIIERSPGKGRGHALLASYYARSGDFARAAALYEEALGHRPSNAKLYVELGKVYLHAGGDEREHATYERAIAAGIRDAQVYAARGDYLFRHMDMRGAAGEYLSALELDGTYAYAYYKLGLIDMAGRQYRSSRSRFATALSLEPGNAVYREYLERAAAYAEQGGR